MKKMLVVLFFFLPIYLIGQATQFVVESFQLDLNDLEANRNPVFDANDKKCALIKVRTDLGDIKLSSNNGIVDQKRVLTEYWVYVSYDEKKINIYKDGFLPLSYEIPLNLEEGKVYTLYITSNKRYSIVIQTDPKEASVILDNVPIKEPNVSNIMPGKHSIRIVRDGYLTLNDTVNVSDGNIFFSYTMEKMELTLLTVTSEPSGAAIIINSEYKGLTPKQLFLFPGRYSMQINKEYYQGKKEEILVSNKSENNFHYLLLSNTSQIEVFTFPKDAQIFLDGKRMLVKTKIEGGEHLLEIKRDLFYADKRILRIKAGIDTVLLISLNPIWGNLQFTVNPINATAKLFKNEVLINNWVGAKRITNLQIGDYTLEVDAKKYRKVEKQIQIKENTTEELFLDLAAERQKGRKGKLAAIGLSMVMPGLGQYYSGYNTRAWVYSISGLGTGALALYYNSEFNKTLKNYEDASVAYENSKVLEDISSTRSTMDGYYEDLNDYDKKRQLFLISFASIYSLNVIDAFIFGKKKEKSQSLGQKNKNYFDIQPITFYDGLGLQFKYTF